MGTTKDKRIRAHKYKPFIERIGKCELCGSTRRLQLHHILPLALVPDNGDYDIEDNWLVVCDQCHGALTPKNLLSKASIGKKKDANRLIKTSWEDGVKYATARVSAEKAIEFYLELEKLCESGERLDVPLVLDIFDDVFGTKEEKPEKLKPNIEEV